MAIPSRLILDLDDTILDYTLPGESVWAHYIPRFAERLGISVERLRAAIDSSRRWYWSDPARHRQGRLNQQATRRRIVRDAFSRLGLDSRDAADELADIFSRERELIVRPFTGAVETLERLHTGGARMVLLTNGESSLQRNKIDRFDLGRFFDAVLIEGETGFGKPEEPAFRTALAALGTIPEESWMIGDDLEFDLLPAKRLGIQTAWIQPAGEAGLHESVDIRAPSLRALLSRWQEF